MVLRYIIWIFVIYALYRLIFNFIIPVVRVSGEMKKKMREFNDTINQQQHSQPDDSLKHSSSAKQKDGDYIDFEEVKS